MLRSLILLNIFISRGSCCCHQTLDQLFTARSRQPASRPHAGHSEPQEMVELERTGSVVRLCSPPRVLSPQLYCWLVKAGAVVRGVGGQPRSQPLPRSLHILPAGPPQDLCVMWRRPVIIHWLAINIVAHYSEF